MDKAVLIIDEPDCCKNCELINSVRSPICKEWYEICKITQRRLYDIEHIDQMCPLLRVKR